MNLTGDDTGWVGFFNLSLAERIAETYQIIQGRVPEHNHEWPPSGIGDGGLIQL